MIREDIFLSLVVPVYNEEDRFETPLPAVHRFLQENFRQSELVYVDDGSTDHTHDRIAQASNKYPLIRIVKSPANAGKGDAIRRGFEAAKGNLLLFSDADFSTPVEETLKFLQWIDEGYDVILGSRGLPDSQVEIHQSFLRESMGKIFNRIIRFLLPLKYRDTQCGFKMFQKKAAETILPRMTLKGFAFDVEMIVIAQLHQMKIAEVPVVWRNVLESKVHPIKNSLEMIRDILKIRYRITTGRYS